MLNIVRNPIVEAKAANLLASMPSGMRRVMSTDQRRGGEVESNGARGRSSVATTSVILRLQTSTW
jgi:hypothetical protein